MPVQIDAPTMWKLTCDHEGQCFNRLYLYAANAETAAWRAQEEYGWRADGTRVWCRDHREAAS